MYNVHDCRSLRDISMIHLSQSELSLVSQIQHSIQPLVVTSTAERVELFIEEACF